MACDEGAWQIAGVRYLLSHSFPLVSLKRMFQHALPARAEKTEGNQSWKAVPTKHTHTLPSSNWVVASFVRGWGGGKELNVLSNLQLI